MERKKVVYISGPTTGVDRYWKAFEQAEEDLIALGYVPLSPAHLPQGLTNEQYMSIDLVMMTCADAVLFLPGWKQSRGSRLEHQHCEYTGKPVVHSIADIFARSIAQTQLRDDLRRVLGV